MLKVFLFCEASNKSGLGHLIRSIALMNEFLEENFCVEMWLDSSIDSSRYLKKIERNVFDLNKFKYEFICDRSICIFDILNWDYGFDNLEKILSSCFSFSISPVSNINNKVNWVLSRGKIENNQLKNNIFGPELAVVGNNVERLSPGDYKNLIQTQNNNVGIVMGGTDPENMTLKIITQLSSITEPTTLWVAIGPSYKFDINLIFKALSKSKYIDLVVGNVFEDLWKFLQSCKLLILQGGLTTTEASFRGIPSINIPRFKNQSLQNLELVSKGACWEIRDGNIISLKPLVEEIVQNEKILMDASRIGQEIIDGKGAKNIKRIILEKTK